MEKELDIHILLSMGVITRDVKSLRKEGDTKLKGDVTLSEGTNITLTQSGQDIEIAAASGGGTEKMLLHFDFSDITNYGTSTNNGTVSAVSGPVGSLVANNAANSYARISAGLQNSPSFNFFNFSNSISFIWDPSSITNNACYYCIISTENTAPAPTIGSGALTSKHIGFILDVSSSTATLYASNANGSAQTKTDVTGGRTLSNSFVLYAVMDGSTDIKFYIDGTLVATHTTNLPSGAASSDEVFWAEARNGSPAAARELLLSHVNIKLAVTP